MELDALELEYVRGVIDAKIVDLGRVIENILLDPADRISRLNAIKARAVLRSALVKLETAPPERKSF